MTNPLNVPGYIPEMDMRLNNTLETALIQNEQEKTYVISYTTELIDNEGFIYGSLPHTEYIQAASIDTALERLKKDKDTINITYIYHD